MDNLLNRFSNGQFTDHFNIDVCREDYSATIDLAECPTKETVIGILESEGFTVTHEESTIYTIQYES